MPSERDGIVTVGQVPVVIRRDSYHEADHTAAVVGGRVAAFRETAEFVDQLLAGLPRYENPLLLQQLQGWLGDKILETQA